MIEQVVLATWRDAARGQCYAVAVTLFLQEPVLLAVAATGGSTEDRLRTVPINTSLGALLAEWAGASPELLSERAEDILCGERSHC